MYLGADVWKVQSGPLKDALGMYVELDFPENTTSKAMAIRRNSVLSSALGDPSLVKIGKCI
jgi:[phosphatase 2A protein]-leucine-carboxy methyltransferase